MCKGKENDDWDEDSYKKARFDERIKMIESAGRRIIPDEIRDNKSKVYGIFSKGIHESSEDECMELFPYLRFAIEKILDERQRKREDDEKFAELNNVLSRQ